MRVIQPIYFVDFRRYVGNPRPLPQVDSGKVSRRVGRPAASGGPIPWYFTTVDIP
jgi:hypothetical protein